MIEYIKLFWEDAPEGEPSVILYEVDTGNEDVYKRQTAEKFGGEAFRAAVSEGNTKLARLLLEKGADINYPVSYTHLDVYKRQKKFCARIATGDYDAIIRGHSQFERIPISRERQERLLYEQIDEITEGIAEVQEMCIRDRYCPLCMERQYRE